MESDLQHQHQLHPHQMEPMGSGLMRYQSAPSSFFSSFLDSDDFFPRRPISPETERIFARFMNSGTDTAPAEVQSEQELQIMDSIKTETVIHDHPNQNQPNNFYHSASQPPRPPIDYRVVNTAGKDRLPPMKMETGGGPNNSNLVRQRSSPAGLFANINIDNELASYAAMRGIGAGYVAGSNMEPSFSTGSSRVPPSSDLRIVAESESKPMGGGLVGPESGRVDGYVTGYPWDDSALVSNKIGGLKRARDDEDGTGTQSGEVGSRRPPSLAHHLSLEKTSVEMAAIENFFQFQDSVPCKIRAKRGCATHPRSIAERVRRTKISERMRKLQELVPNMDKQTNTSDMLDLAVDYIKELQKEVEILSDSRSKCTCPHKQHS